MTQVARVAARVAPTAREARAAGSVAGAAVLVAVAEAKVEEQGAAEAGAVAVAARARFRSRSRPRCYQACVEQARFWRTSLANTAV